jgi:hypothetical protein
VKWHRNAQQPEQGQDDGRYDDTDRIGAKGIQNILGDGRGRLEAAKAGQDDEYEKVERDEERHSKRMNGKAERPHLHGHQKRQPEDDRAARCPRQSARIVDIG